jgi:hypothetical protein
MYSRRPTIASAASRAYSTLKRTRGLKTRGCPRWIVIPKILPPLLQDMRTHNGFVARPVDC